jgi:hypothetical protein
VFLGSARFIERFAQPGRALARFREIPRAQRRPLARALSHFARTYPDGREGMARAFLTGVYTMQEIADHFAKTGTSRQADLVKPVASCISPRREQPAQ